MEHRDIDVVSDDEDIRPGGMVGSTGPRGWAARRLRPRSADSPPAPRRVAIRRIAVTLTVAAVGLIGLFLGGAKVRDWSVRYLHERPEAFIEFHSIELSPPAPAGIRRGSAGILEDVRNEAKRPERIPLYGIDLAELRKDFLRNPWVRDVRRVQILGPGRLRVELDYREPVALVAPITGGGFYVDDTAVILPPEDILPQGVKSRIQIVGKGIQPPYQWRPGLSWNEGKENDPLTHPNARVGSAARLARWLHDRTDESPQAQPALRFTKINVDEDGHQFIQNVEDAYVWWGESPGSEPKGDLTAAEKWELIEKWVKENKGIKQRYPGFLYFKDRQLVPHHSDGVASRRTGRVH